jgi:hypothetical protein
MTIKKLILKHLGRILALLFIVALVVSVLTCDEPIVSFLKETSAAKFIYNISWKNSIFFSIAIGFIASLFSWLLVWYIPDQYRRDTIKNNLKWKYSAFKKEITTQFLFASGSCADTRLIQELCEFEKFRAYFISDNKERWYRVLNVLEEQEKSHILKEIINQMVKLADELSYVINNIYIKDERSHICFSDLAATIYSLENTATPDRKVSDICDKFLFGIFACFNSCDGYLEEDPIQKMIDEL